MTSTITNAYSTKNYIYSSMYHANIHVKIL